MRILFFILTNLLFHSAIRGQFNVSGLVKNIQGQSIPGVVVNISGTYLATTTDASGKYRFDNIADAEVSLEFRMLGYARQEVRLDLSKSRTYDCVLKEQPFLADEVVILGTRADDRSGMAYTTLGKEDIARQNFGADIPMLLGTQPSVVSTSDAGTGIGYTGIRVRGSDATRTNVTINGIPYNDSESHGVFWVNMPDFASSVKSIQLQRGVGSSTNGAGAFGASINMQTNDLRGEPYGNYTFSGGSFNTLRNTFEAGTGLIRGFTFDIRASRISSDGFIDRASSNLESWFASGGWHSKNSSVKLNIFSGREKTYQAWYGVPQYSLKTNRRYNPAGSYTDENGRERFYDNETDNYQQNHYQLFFNHDISQKTLLSIALHYTRGIGYYEQYKQQDKLSNYNLDPFVQFKFTADSLISDTITRSDLIRQRWLDNHFYGTVFSLTINPDVKTKVIFGGGLNQYSGKHFGEVIWAQYGNLFPKGYRYYDNDGLKTDFNIYVKANREITERLTVSADLQYRTVSYSFLGFNDQLESVQQNVNLNFFNPKLAINFDLGSFGRSFLSWSVGHREPVRDDYTESSPQSRPQPEQLHDIELGYRIGRKRLEFAATAYYMQYYNQLVLTGAVNDVGAYTRINVYDSYRAGIELEAGWKPFSKLTLTGNLAFSENRIRSAFREGVFDYESNTEKSFVYRNTNISFSPSVIGAAILRYEIGTWANVSLTGKYVGKQYLDNTSSEKRKLDPFSVFSFQFNITPPTGYKPGFELAFQVNNLFNSFYSPNGYTFSDLNGSQRNDYNYYFPQAGINFMMMAKVNIN
jgi:iron complex outermembrane receptor protein